MAGVTKIARALILTEKDNFFSSKCENIRDKKYYKKCMTKRLDPKYPNKKNVTKKRQKCTSTKLNKTNKK